MLFVETSGHFATAFKPKSDNVLTLLLQLKNYIEPQITRKEKFQHMCQHLIISAYQGLYSIDSILKVAPDYRAAVSLQPHRTDSHHRSTFISLSLFFFFFFCR